MVPFVRHIGHSFEKINEHRKAIALNIIYFVVVHSFFLPFVVVRVAFYPSLVDYFLSHIFVVLMRSVARM